MKFSELEAITFTLKKFSFEISPEVSKFANKDVTMKFKEGKVYFLGQTWQGKEIEIDNDMIVLYLFFSNDKNVFRIRLVMHKGEDFLKDFISGEIRVFLEGDFWIEAMLIAKSAENANEKFIFHDIDDKLQKYIPENENETKKFWSGDKTDKTKDYWNWTDEQFETWLIKKIGEEEAKKLLDEGINRTFLSKLTETNLKLMGLKFNSIFLLLDEIKNLLE